MNSHQILSLYETVAELTEKMLSAARVGDWDRLASLESDCAGQIQILRDGDKPQPLTGEVRARKVKIIRKILADDREIRDLTEPWMAKLSSLISNSGNERKLNQAYGGAYSG